jgi:hypothetical protein
VPRAQTCFPVPLGEARLIEPQLVELRWQRVAPGCLLWSIRACDSSARRTVPKNNSGPSMCSGRWRLTVGIGLRPSRCRECHRSPADDSSAQGQTWGWGRDALGLSHLTYDTSGTFNLHQLDQPPFPCKPKILRTRQPRQARFCSHTGGLNSLRQQEPRLTPAPGSDSPAPRRSPPCSYSPPSQNPRPPC